MSAMATGSTLAIDGTRARRDIPARMADGRPAPAFELRRGLKRLSPSQLRLAQLVVRGLTDKECATRLNLSEGTVKIYNSQIYARLKVGGRYGLIAYWTSQKLRMILRKHSATIPLEALDDLSRLAAWLNRREETPEWMLG